MFGDDDFRNSLCLVFLSAVIIFVPACKRRSEPNKIMDTLPVNSTTMVIPAVAAKQMLLLKRDLAKVVVPVVNKLGLLNQVYPELTGPDGMSQYTFQRTESSYGTINFTIQFRDNANAVIDPIQNQASTTTLAALAITSSGNSNEFTYSETLTLTLDTVGNVGSKKRLTGTSGFDGFSYNITFTYPFPGVTNSFDGISEGVITASGSGGPANTSTTLSLSLSADHSADGTIAWEDQDGGIHIRDNGAGYIITGQSLIFIQ